MDDELTPIPARPARPLAPWLGGKRHLAERIVDRIRAIPHRLYAEPFLDQGGVFLRRPFKAHGEVVNDVEMMRWYLTSRAEFDRLSAAAPETLSDLERAARFLYLQRTAFDGKVAGQHFGVTFGGTRFDIIRLVPQLEAVHERLAGVVRSPRRPVLSRSALLGIGGGLRSVIWFWRSQTSI